MMALAKCVGHTKASLGYGWNDEKKAIVVYRNNIMGESPEEITREFKLLQDQNYQCKNNTISIVLSLSTKNKVEVDNTKWNKIINEFVTEMNLQEHQAIAFKHQDKNHLHCHLYVNRIGNDGKAYSSSYIGKRSGLIADRISEKYGLARPMQMKKDRERSTRALRNEIFDIHNMVLNCLQKRSYERYIKLMAENEVRVKPVRSKNGNLNGFRYYYKEKDFKASEIHRSMSLNNLHQALYDRDEGWLEQKEIIGSTVEYLNNTQTNDHFVSVLDHICQLLRKPGYSDKSSGNNYQEAERKKKKKKKRRKGRGI